ncbi:lipase family protein [Lysobacter sp. cf310]|uniref:lipase family protein n=1 Tax=Lysobacter sp. cf310 TaxID=1761790 RepID=UPI0008F3BA0B|nr:lipase family protein [Lysobacter sp. cf310]SFK97076.1 Alpha/beta hydrolase family protein [Lysobacter sp. cf310]
MPLDKLMLGFIAAAAIALSGCGALRSSTAHQTDGRDRAHRRGELIQLEALGPLDRAHLQRIASEFPGQIPVAGGAELYRIVYWTRHRGAPIRASGLYAVPERREASKGTVVYLHGTQITRASSPSQPARVDGNEETAVFAGNGYEVVLPDYIGLGVSTEPQAYLIAAAQADATLDLLRAARSASIGLGRRAAPSLFLMGFSQGGQSAAAVHRALEREPLAGYRLRGSIGIAGPYDLRALVVNKLAPAHADAPNNAGYFAFIANAYSGYYGHALDETLTPEYAAAVPALFDGSKTPEQLAPVLPADARSLFRPEFLRALQADQDNWLTRALEQNRTDNWAPVAPFRIYYGDDDSDVLPQSAQAFYAYAKAHGGNVSLHALGAVDHWNSAALTYAPALAWFDALSAAQ